MFETVDETSDARFDIQLHERSSISRRGAPLGGLEMAKSRARLVIWCLVLASLGFELAKWRRAGNWTQTRVGTHLGGAHHFGSHVAQHRHRVGDHTAGKTDAGSGVHERIHKHARTQAVLRRALPAHAVDTAADGDPSDRERREEVAVPSEGNSPPEGDASCLGFPGVEYAGEVVEGGWGADPTRGLAASAAACCARCRTHAACNVWVFCDPAEKRCGARALAGQCWLKRQTLLRGVAPSAMASGEATPWTSGYFSDSSFDADAVVMSPNSSDVERWFKPLDVARLTPEYGGAESTRAPKRSPRRRECGDPAADAYASVNASCLERSRTAVEALAFQNVLGSGDVRLVAWHEPHASFDGLAVRWGIGHKHPSAAACAAACVRHVPVGAGARGGPFGALPCNAFVWCPVDVAGGTCFEPDAHAHSAGDCWLKFTEVPEAPQVNQRGANDDDAFRDARGVSYRDRHPDAPALTHWTSGVVLPSGWVPSRGTYGPRARW